MLDVIGQIPLLYDLNKEQLELLNSLFEVFTCPADHPIFEQNDQASYLYLLISGKVVLHYKPYDGTRIVLTHLNPGDVFGWSAVVGESVYTSGIYSETEVKAVRIRGSDLQKLCREHPDLGSIMLDRLAEAVSGRWQDSRRQVQAILARNLNQNEKSK